MEWKIVCSEVVEFSKSRSEMSQTPEKEGGWEAKKGKECTRSKQNVEETTVKCSPAKPLKHTGGHPLWRFPAFYTQYRPTSNTGNILL